MKIVNGQRFYALTLSVEQLAVIQEGLFLTPYGRAAPVVAVINEQLKAEEATATPPVAPPAPASMSLLKPDDKNRKSA